jgi:hypothetical protein
MNTVPAASPIQILGAIDFIDGNHWGTALNLAAFVERLAAVTGSSIVSFGLAASGMAAAGSMSLAAVGIGAKSSAVVRPIAGYSRVLSASVDVADAIFAGPCMKLATRVGEGSMEFNKRSPLQ